MGALTKTDLIHKGGLMTCFGKKIWTQHFSRVSKRVQSFVGSSNTSVVFIGELTRYSSSGAFGRNHIRRQNPPVLKLVSLYSWNIGSVRWGRNIPGLDIDEVLATMNEICCNWLSLYIFCNLLQDLNIYHCHYRVIMHIILRHFLNYMCRSCLFIYCIWILHVFVRMNILYIIVSVRNVKLPYFETRWMIDNCTVISALDKQLFPVLHVFTVMIDYGRE